MTKKVQETVAHRIYGPYLTRGKIAWYVIRARGEKKVFKSKIKMLEYVDIITTNLTKKERIEL